MIVLGCLENAKKMECHSAGYFVCRVCRSCICVGSSWICGSESCRSDNPAYSETLFEEVARFGSSKYISNAMSLSWEDARQTCIDNGGKLDTDITITNKETFRCILPENKVGYTTNRCN